MSVTDRTGEEFAPALRGAIAARGLSLDQLRRALAREGVTVSVATLSYWQSGRSRPERTSSLAAIGPLEECLGLPRGFLASRLPAVRRPQDDRYERASLPAEQEVRTDAPDMAAAQLGLSYDDAQPLSIHDRHILDHRRTETAQEVRLLLQARRDGLDRFPVWFASDDEAVFPVVTAVTNCEVGRVREFREYGGAVVEMLLERPLRRGETTLVEHRQTLVGPQNPRVTTCRAVPCPSREIVIEIQFDPDALPRSATASMEVGDSVTSSPLEVHRTIQAHFSDAPAGLFRVSWEWDDPAPGDAPA